MSVSPRQALKVLSASHSGSDGAWHMDDHESETKFDHLNSTTDIVAGSNLLTRVPSVKNLKNLRSLMLGSNKITRIEPGERKAESRAAESAVWL